MQGYKKFELGKKAIQYYDDDGLHYVVYENGKEIYHMTTPYEGLYRIPFYLR